MTTSPATLLVETPTTIDLGPALVHLVSGEDIIGRTEYDTDNKVYTVSHPVIPVMSPKVDAEGNQTGGVGMRLAPYRPFLDVDEPLRIRDANVLFTGKLQDNLAKHYLELTSSVIIADARTVGGNFANVRVQ